MDSRLYMSRVLHEDDEFVTLEVAKRDDVVFNLAMNDDGVVVGGDQFHTIVFVRNDGHGKAVPWKPW